MKHLFTVQTDRAVITAKTDTNKMKLFISVEKIDKKAPLKEEIVNALKEHIDVTKINMGVIEDIIKKLKTEDKVEDRRILKGIEPVKGQNGKIVYLVKPYNAKNVGLKKDEKGFVKYGELNLFDNIIEDQKIARIYHPKPGKDGIDVLGNPIKAQDGEPVKVTLDSTIKQIQEEGKDYDTLISQTHGYLKVDGNNLSIEDTLRINGDIDYHCGNIDFIGKVFVAKDVKPGFKVTAVDGIEIEGAVWKGDLFCKKGDIIVKGIINGGGVSKILANGSVFLNGARDCEIQAKGDIRSNGSISRCIVRSSSAIFIDQGSLVGGVAFSVCGIEADYIGNSSGKETDLVLCSNIEATSDYAKLIVDIFSHNKAIDLIKLHLGPYLGNQARIVLLKPDHRTKIEKLLKKLKQIEQSRDVLLKKQQELLEESSISLTARVNAKKVIYSGVRLKAGNIEYIVEEDISGPVSLAYYLDKEEIVQEGLKEITCNFEIHKRKPNQEMEGDND